MKKISPRTSTVEVDVKFPENLSTDFDNIKFIREYQGFLFLLDQKKGIHVFNGMGTLDKTIPCKPLSYFNFLGEEMYYPVGNGLAFMNLFSGEKREIPLQQDF